MPRNGSTERALRAGSIQKKSAKSIACQRCHLRKVKCSGGHPCLNCRDAGVSADGCEYPSRDRHVKLSQQYVEELLKENERLRNKSASTTPTAHVSTVDEVRDSQQDTEASGEALQNPLLEDRPWFHPVSTLDVPIHVGEAADAAFATRFRQTLATGCASHILRTSYVQDDPLWLLSDSKPRWPAPARARFLVKAALSTVCQYYHIVRRSEVLESLEDAIQSNGSGDRVIICKLLALFALGEAYSAKNSAQEATFPGLAYFAQSWRMAGVLAERPQMDVVEVSCLLVIYSYALNRRHSAYMFASSAVRLCLIMGMNLNVPEHQVRNRLAREHRVRLWWTAFILDRTCASKLGLPVSVAEDDVMVDLPNGEGLEPAGRGDFGDSEYLLASMELSKLAAKLTRTIYSRRNHFDPFSKRVQAMLKDLTKWMDLLPEKFHLKDSDDLEAPSNNVLYIHLTFNQCVILATRPILLHVLRTHRQTGINSAPEPQSSLSDSALTLTETCIHAARHTYRLLTEAWICGTFATFDYFNTQYLFSAATILAVSSLLRSSASHSDGDNFNNAFELLQQLDQSGNYGARDFCEHLGAMKQSMEVFGNSASTNDVPPRSGLHDVSFATQFQATGPIMTAGMALAEPSLRELLADSNLDIQAFSNPIFDGLQTPYWPEIWGDGWGVGGNI